MVAYPAGDIFRRGIDIQHLVDILVVEGILDYPLDMGEVSYHTVLIQRLCLAENGNYPVVPMQCLALAFITEIQIVCR